MVYMGGAFNNRCYSDFYQSVFLSILLRKSGSLK